MIVTNQKPYIDISIVGTKEDWADLMAVRHEVFDKELGEPTIEQFDGNDYCSTHLLARLNGLAVGCFRIRFISSFDGGTVAWEKLGVVEGIRKAHPRIFHQLAKSALSYTSMKGIRNVVGIAANLRLLKFWRRFGFERTNEPPVYYRDIEYIPMKLVINGIEPSEVGIKQALIPESQMFENQLSA